MRIEPMGCRLLELSFSNICKICTLDLNYWKARNSSDNGLYGIYGDKQAPNHDLNQFGPHLLTHECDMRLRWVIGCTTYALREEAGVVTPTQVTRKLSTQNGAYCI